MDYNKNSEKRPMTLGVNDPDIVSKANTLLEQMSLDQKIGQMTQAEILTCSPEDVRNYRLGAVLSGSGSHPAGNRPSDWVKLNDDYWTAAMSGEAGQPSIPILFGTDAIHGHSNVCGATLFPHNIGLGAAHDPELVHRIAQVTAREVLATGLEWNFAPTLAVAQNIRWGRTYESFSEHPDLVSAYAEAYVQGLQENFGEASVLACAKHWVGDGGTENGIEQGDTNASLTTLRDTHIAPYRAAIGAGALTIMTSFSSWQGAKCHGHKLLLTDILKKELQFGGFLLSDWEGLSYLSEDYHSAVGKAVNAGIDMFMVPESWQLFIQSLTRHVRNGSVPIARINDAVRRILSVKLAYGLFDRPRPAERQWSGHASFGSTAHRLVAREAVRKSLVLLKNEKSVLPLCKSHRILVAGKNAHNRGHQCGGFSIDWQGVSDNDAIQGGTSIWEGIQAIAENATLSTAEHGTDADATLHDVAIVVIGEEPYAEGPGDLRLDDQTVVGLGSQINGEMVLREPYGYSLELCRLHPEDLRTIINIADRGIPVVVVLVSGRPLIINPELERATAFVAAWLPGSEGQGVADVLFGDYDFQGTLSFAWPKVEADVVVKSGPEYQPLFHRGYGLTYKQKPGLLLQSFRRLTRLG